VTLVIIVGATLKIPSGGGAATEISRRNAPVKPMDLSAFSSAPPSAPLRLLFIHHSVGGALFAEPGAADAVGDCIWKKHPEGGGARLLLERHGYEVHEASYGSAIGEATDLFDWLPKFRDDMDRVRACSFNDQPLPAGKHNQVVVFKSCFPNNAFVGEGTAPGDPKGPDLTLWNARATMNALRDVLARHPEVLFVYLTTPPLARRPQSEALWKWLAKEILRKPHSHEQLDRSGPLARQFNDWVADGDGWLKDYPGRNVVVFDYYDILTNHGASNFSAYPTGDGSNSHPSRAGNQQAATELLPFLNRAVRRAGLSD
jgi:hypothetical protein